MPPTSSTCFGAWRIVQMELWGGRLFLHNSDDSAFVAEQTAAADRRLLRPTASRLGWSRLPHKEMFGTLFCTLFCTHVLLPEQPNDETQAEP